MLRLQGIATFFSLFDCKRYAFVASKNGSTFPDRALCVNDRADHAQPRDRAQSCSSMALWLVIAGRAKREPGMTKYVVTQIFFYAIRSAWH